MMDRRLDWFGKELDTTCNWWNLAPYSGCLLQIHHLSRAPVVNLKANNSASGLLPTTSCEPPRPPTR
jgi:hypothetical protein